jgi:hypothetical protein
VTLPKTFVFGIAHTSDYGAAPYGDNTSCHGSTEVCGYDSLNIGLSQDPDNLSKGSSPYPGYVWWNTSTASDYCRRPARSHASNSSKEAATLASSLQSSGQIGVRGDHGSSRSTPLAWR